jgi:hypothetical protein
MKKRFFLLIILVSLLARIPARADEGMWVPLFLETLNYQDMKSLGLQLTAEQIYSINQSSLKDAIGIFGRGCTCEVVSDQGLILTNHHCGYGLIQQHSSLEHDYLSNGFWAQTREEELSCPTLSIRFLIRIEDVTRQIVPNLNDDMSETDRNNKISELSKKIEEAATKDTHYEASVRSFFRGNEFYLFVFENYRDVRLVGAPPSSIGNFGGDTDNWMWPRHTGDFSMFRIYTDKEGKPAEYSKDNIPLNPRYYLPVSLGGVRDGDFAMILGFPGGTQRFLNSSGVDLAVGLSNPTTVAIRDIRLKLMREDMDRDDAVRIKYASKYARVANYWKYYIGQTKGLKRLKVSEKKRLIEADFTRWCQADPARNRKYGKALQLLREGYDIQRKYIMPSIYFGEAINGVELLSFAGRYSGLYEELLKKEPDKEKMNKMVEGLKRSAVTFYKDYNPPTDKKMLAAMFDMYYRNVPPDQQPAFLKELYAKYKGDFKAYAEKVFATSLFVNQQAIESFLSAPSLKKLEKDMAFQAFKAFSDQQQLLIMPEMRKAGELLARGNRLFIAGYREMNPEKKFYPDANSTMRLTYGQVLDYYPADAVHYDYFTTLKGVMEKEDPGNDEFIVPDKLKELYNNKDYGPYGENGVMKTCFLSNLDITGGNSGSPVLNANGELIGLAFDGNWEAMSGDIAYEPQYQRTISVDIRYVLFIIDKYAGAKHLVDEMTLVSSHPMVDPELMKKADKTEEVLENE